jgi:hypothetical protein
VRCVRRFVGFWRRKASQRGSMSELRSSKID